MSNSDRTAGLFGLFITLAFLALTVHGLYLAFSASILLGIICLFVEPSPLLISLVYIFWNVNLAEKFVQWLQLVD